MNNKWSEPNAPWRNEPASENQRRRLTEDGIAFRSRITKGEASDLISSSVPPEGEDMAVLKFFNVRLSAGASELDALHAISKIFSEPSNLERWNKRPATKEQRDIVKAVEGKVPTGLTYDDAEKRISDYDDDDQLSEKAEEAIEAQERKELFRDHHQSLNEDGSIYGLKRTSLALVTRAISEWEVETGQTLEKLERDDYFFDRLAERIRILDPSKATREYGQMPEVFRPWAYKMNSPKLRQDSPPSRWQSQNKSESSPLTAILALMIAVAIIVWVFR